MSLSVAYDITKLAELYASRDYKVGISRTVERLLIELIKINTIDLKIVSICGNSPPLSTVASNLYIQEVHNLNHCVDSDYKSVLLSKFFYQTILTIYCNINKSKSGYYLPRSLAIKAFYKFLDKISIISRDTYYIFEPINYNLIHFTSPQLPKKNVIKMLPKLITVYDLIPIKATHYTNSLLSKTFQDFLHNINIQKDWVTCISEYTRQEFCEYTGMSLERAFVTPLAADEQFYPVDNPEEIQLTRQRYNLPEGDYFLCLASHLEPRKNIPFLIRSFIQLINEQPNLDINLVLIGSLRHKRPELITLMEELKAYQNRVIFTGYVPDEDLSALYSGAKAFIFPSLQEGFGLPILEAMQCGTPVISSNATSLPEVAGEAAILINPYDKDELSQAMLNLLSDEKLRNELTQKGIERAKQFSWSKCAQETVEIYKKIAK